MRGTASGAGWTILRPTVVYGLAFGNPMNMTTVLGVYAAISRELGLPLRFPGSDTAYRTICQAVDAALIARAFLWACDSPKAANQIYNITNGDMFRWSRMWPHVARKLGMEVAEQLDRFVKSADVDQDARMRACDRVRVSKTGG